MLIANRYELHEPLGQGGMGVVYRAIDRLNGTRVAIKRLLVMPERLTFGSSDPDSEEDDRVLLAREFQTLASLRHPNVISVLDYGFDDERQPYFSMPLLDDAQTIREAALALDLQGRVGLLIQLLQALAYLHRRGILHRDLKPGNVLVTGDQLRVLDFGLAVDHETGIQTAGTLAYMAPEVLQGEPTSRAADLYAVGVMAYEILTGEHPYRTASQATLIRDILENMPPLVQVMVPDGPTTAIDYRGPLPDADPNVPLGTIIMRLLQKDPAARYPDAESVMAGLSMAVDYPLQAETQAIRESFLQAARFVGRDIETAHLTGALGRAIGGRGSVWLVGGESGVGKSRLVDELRVRALVRGVNVLMGQGAVDGGLPYHLWREPLRHLALSTPLSEAEAGILRDLVPDIDALLGHPVAPAVEASGEEYQRRLIATISAILNRQQRPLLLVLEDLHWANESLDILRYLCEAVADLPVLVVGTFRDDERPDIPAQVPAQHLLSLERLAPHQVAELSHAMLGRSNPELEVLLQRETEGNVFFLVETVRALAEEAGSLSAVTTMELPRQVIAGGVEEIVRRRLGLVPSVFHPMLQLAALWGRQLDLDVLGATDIGQTTDLDVWLFACANVAVLEPQETGWRFSHDRLRERLVNDLAPEERPALHRQLAEAIEAVYPNAAEYAAILADHWGAAGMHDRERRYATLAAQQASRRSAFREAITYYRRAIELLPTTGAHSERAMIQVGLADTYYQLSEYLQATYLYQESLRWARSSNDRLIIAKALAGLGRVYGTRGEHRTARTLLEESLEISRELEDRQGQGRTTHALAVVRHTQGDREFAITLFREAAALARAVGDQQGELDSLSGLGMLYKELGQVEEALRFEHRALELARQSGNRLGEARALGNLGSIYFRQRRLPDAIAHSQQALAIAREIGNRRGVSIYLTGLGNAYVAQGRLDRAGPLFEEAITISQAIGDQRSTSINLLNLAVIKAKTGHLEAALSHFMATLPLLQDDPLQQAHVLLNITYALITLNDLEAALDYSTRGLAVARQVGDPSRESTLLRDQAHVQLCQGRVSVAIDTARRALDVALQSHDLQRQCRASNILAWALLQAGEAPEARQVIEAAAALDVPDDDDHLEATLGVICLYDGEPEAAVAAFERAKSQSKRLIADSPDNYQSWYTLGLAEAGLAAVRGDSLAAATAAYREALEIAPYAGIIAQARRELRALAQAGYGELGPLQAVLVGE